MSRRSCTTAQSSRPVCGLRSPTGFIGPYRSVSTPRRAMTSTGMQPSNTAPSSKPCTGASFALTSSRTKASYSSRVMGQFT